VTFVPDCSPLDAATILERLQSIFDEGVAKAHDLEGVDPAIEIVPKAVASVSTFLKSDPALSFDLLLCLSALDLKEQLGVVYHLFSMRHRHRIVLKCFVPRESPELPTVERVWRGANWHEREAFDMMGIRFRGHSNLKRILCPDDWEGYPLRKDYEQPEFYRGMRVKPTEIMVKEATRKAGGVGGFGVGPFD